MMEIVEKIDAKSRIWTSDPEKGYHIDWTPQPMSAQKISGVPRAPMMRLRCRKNRTRSRRHRLRAASIRDSS